MNEQNVIAMALVHDHNQHSEGQHRPNPLATREMAAVRTPRSRLALIATLIATLSNRQTRREDQCEARQCIGEKPQASLS